MPDANPSPNKRASNKVSYDEVWIHEGLIFIFPHGEKKYLTVLSK